MPEPEKFLLGFNLKVGLKQNGYVCTHANANHKVIRRYQEYKYDIILTFKNEGHGDYHALYHFILDLSNEKHIIYGIKNPYLCIIDPIEKENIIGNEDKEVTFYLVGHSYRS